MYFDGKVDLETKRAKFYDQDAVSRYIASLAGHPIRVKIEKGGKRTEQQNKWLWGVAYKLIADHTGYTPEEIHEVCKQKFNPRAVMISNKTTGETETFIVGGTTTQLNKREEWELYKERVQQLGAELGVIIPDPDQRDFLDE